MLHILNWYLASFTNLQIESKQTSFVVKKGIRKKLLIVRQLIEKKQELNIATLLYSIDYAKVFNAVKWSRLSFSWKWEFPNTYINLLI